METFALTEHVTNRFSSAILNHWSFREGVFLQHCELCRKLCIMVTMCNYWVFYTTWRSNHALVGFVCFFVQIYRQCVRQSFNGIQSLCLCIGERLRFVHELSACLGCSCLFRVNGRNSICFRNHPVKSSVGSRRSSFRRWHLAYAFVIPCELYLIRRAETVGSSECRRSS